MLARESLTPSLVWLSPDRSSQPLPVSRWRFRRRHRIRAIPSCNRQTHAWIKLWAGIGDLINDVASANAQLAEIAAQVAIKRRGL